MFQNMKMRHLPDFQAKMASENLPEQIIKTFSNYYETLVNGNYGLIGKNQIDPLPDIDVSIYNDVRKFMEEGKAVADRTVIIKLNGGLGTSMGLTRAKSLIKIKENRSFLEIILRQAEKIGIQLVLMNSYNTHADTFAACEALNPTRMPKTFLQHKFPKIHQSDYSPANYPENPDLEWNPPGHGDIYPALVTSGLLDDLTSDGIRYAFISNSDNLGAVMDLSLLGYFAHHQFSFMMEVAKRTFRDCKGGHLAKHKTGRLVLREVAQCPSEELKLFQDITLYKYFNTNNIWLNLDYLKQYFEKHDVLNLPIIVNPKNLNPRDKTSPKVFQIETAMGSAISLFENAKAVLVPRTRFFPVKQCADLLSVNSDRLLFADDFHLLLNPHAICEEIDIKLDNHYYSRIDQIKARFPLGAPSLVNCCSFHVNGDVVFGADIICRGNVNITNPNPTPAHIPDNSLLEGDINL